MDDKPETIITQKLGNTIKAHGEDVSELKYRVPTGADLCDLGNPVICDMTRSPPLITHDPRVLPGMIARLAGITPGSVRQMLPADIAAAGWLLTDFFVPAL